MRTRAPYGVRVVWQGGGMVVKALCCSAPVFLAAGWCGVWLRRRRGR
ncbi:MULTISPECIES: hypothetical protein [unclassified Micromonospora]